MLIIGEASKLNWHGPLQIIQGLQEYMWQLPRIS